MLIGINANPIQGFSADELAQLGVKAVRFPLWRESDGAPCTPAYRPFLERCQEVGIDSLAVIDKRSCTQHETERHRFEKAISHWCDAIGDLVTAWQIGNEPDQPDSTSSWQMSAEDFTELLRSARHILGSDVWLIAGGLVSGSPAYLDGVDLSPVDAIGIHPYTHIPDSVDRLIDLYRPYDKPIAVTELGAPGASFSDEHARALWHSHMLARLDALSIPEAYIFCYSDTMVAGFGLVDGDGNPYESYAAVHDAAQAASAPQPLRHSPPTILEIPGRVAGRFSSTPHGILLHGTRSGRSYTTSEEFSATCSYVRSGANGLGWHVTVGPGVIAVHMSPMEWGWNARSQSRDYLAIEFAQPTVNDPISDHQIDAAAWWIREVARPAWPELPGVLVHHSEIPAGIRDGKTDLYPRGSADADTFRQRLAERINGW